MSEIQHIVLWSFESASDLKYAARSIKSLEEKALRDGKPYISSVKCGTTRPYAPIRSHGFNLATVIRFNSDEDLEYFMHQDPAHKDLVEALKDKLTSSTLVLDFVDGSVEDVSFTKC